MPLASETSAVSLVLSRSLAVTRVAALRRSPAERLLPWADADARPASTTLIYPTTPTIGKMHDVWAMYWLT